jgi:hypothetical protein
VVPGGGVVMPNPPTIQNHPTHKLLIAQAISKAWRVGGFFPYFACMCAYTYVLEIPSKTLQPSKETRNINQRKELEGFGVSASTLHDLPNLQRRSTRRRLGPSPSRTMRTTKLRGFGSKTGKRRVKLRLKVGCRA